MRVSDDVKEQVREATDIVALVGEKVSLRRAGHSWKGLCPFHAERTPSFTVTPERQVWHCFGCGKGGDAFAWLIEMEKVAFPEALQILADRAGIELPKQERGPGDAARDRLYQVTALANDYFRANFAAPAGAEARDYLAARGFEGPALDAFQVGWAPPSWEGLVTTLAKLAPMNVLEEAGLVLRRGDGSRYDRFRNRVIFPVLGPAGRVAGFGARAIAPDDQPKYLNSPETAVYRKGSLLYGLSQARASIRDRQQALVAEGYLDVLRLHMSGFPNAVASSGTALTFEQARALARTEAEVILVYDGDDAGVRAADRALDPMMRAGLAVRILLLPVGDDPDSFLRREGAGAFQALLDGARDPAAFLAEAGLRGGGANPGVEARVRRFVEILRPVPDPIRRRLMVRRGAEAFGLEESVFLQALESRRDGASVGKARVTPGDRGADPPAGAEMKGDRNAEGGTAEGGGEAPEAAPDRTESELAARVLTEDGALLELLDSGGADRLRHRGLRELLRPWLHEGRIPMYAELRELLGQNGLARAVLADRPVPDEPLTLEASRLEARGLIERLERRRIRAGLDELDRAIREAERTRDQDSIERLAAERTDLASKLHSRSQSVIT